MFHRHPLLLIILPGLALGLLVTALSWTFPASADGLFDGPAWPWLPILTGFSLSLAAIRLAGRTRPKPLYLLAVVIGTALAYLFPELFAPGCNGLPRALAGPCPPACQIPVCTNWDAPGENGCNPPPGALGCCVSYGTTCDPNCDEDDDDDPVPTPVPISPPIISGSVSCALPGSNGWCRNGAALNLSASDPQGYATTITGDIAGVAYSCPGPTCVRSLPAGSGAIHFQATSPASGRSSAVGSASFAYDPTPPVITFTPTGAPGANGWYISPVTLTIAATDALSGVALVEYRLDGGAWTAGTSLVLGEGEHVVEARATDRAGNRSVVTAAETIGLQVDSTPPTLSTSLDGEMGLNNWYVSDVTVSAIVSDATSGVSLTEYRVDGGGWTPGTRVVVAADGAHTVQFRVTDQAGNQATEQRSFQIDQTPPLSGFTTPLDASTGALARGDFLLAGQSSDAASGLETVQISTDEGQTWHDLAVSPAGAWRHTWQTRPLENGLYPVLARTQDRAGNLNDAARVTLLLANHPPKVAVQDSWWVWEAGKLVVQERFLPVTDISLRIACLDGQPDVKLNFTLESLPSVLQWDRKCGQGQFATPGEHRVTLKACDQVGNCASAAGTIRVPFIPPTATSTATPTATATASPAPTRQPRQPTPTATQALVALTPEPPVELPPEQPRSIAWLWPLAALVGLWLAFGVSSLLDPRPAALRRLDETWKRLGNVHG